jgi:hypothetical protein
MLLGGQGGLEPTWNLGFQLTLFQPDGADYAHLISLSPPGFEILTASLYILCASLLKLVPTLSLAIFYTSFSTIANNIPI